MNRWQVPRQWRQLVLQPMTPAIGLLVNDSAIHLGFCVASMLYEVAQ